MFLYAVIFWAALGLAGGVYALIKDPGSFYSYDQLALFGGTVMCIVLGPIMLAGMIFLFWWGNKYASYSYRL